ncbi:DUF2231 domain-containing protein [Methylolobus aquaticus]
MNQYWHLLYGSFGLPQLHGAGGDEGGGLVGLVETFLAAITDLLDSSSQWVLLPGIQGLGSNLHPMIVHFPIALLATFFLLELAGLGLHRPALRQVAAWMLYLGAAGAVVAATAGFLAAAEVPHGGQVHEIMEWHQRLMVIVSVLAVVLALWRGLGGMAVSTMAVGLHLFLATAMMGLMVFGTDLGGLMVYRYGVGVASLQSQEEAHQHLHSAVEEPMTRR